MERAIREHYPMTPEQEGGVPPGVRLARFVPLAECERCKLATEDHRLFPEKAILVCLKDVRRAKAGAEGEGEKCG